MQITIDTNISHNDKIRELNKLMSILGIKNYELCSDLVRELYILREYSLHYKNENKLLKDNLKDLSYADSLKLLEILLDTCKLREIDIIRVIKEAEQNA